MRCKICDGETIEIGTKRGRFKDTMFSIRSCVTCHYSFVANPWTDYGQIYSADYYAGQGIDPLVDYVFELEHPHATIRRYEWRGILRAVQSLTSVTKETRWLDFGCGNGGLIRYCREHTGCAMLGYESGWIAEYAASGIPFVDEDELDTMAGTFDVVTAIEVLEHVENPCEVLTHIFQLLKPGGLFFFTTGNARPYRDRLLTWPYVIPEIHISYFEPETMTYALRHSGFTPEFVGMQPGFSDIIRFKILKNLKKRVPPFWDKLLPWPIIARLVNRRMGIMKHPIGRKVTL